MITRRELRLLACLGLVASCFAAEDSTTAALVPSLIDHREALQDIPFPEVIFAATGHRVIPVDPKNDAAMLRNLGDAINVAVATLNAPEHAIHQVARVNEASRHVEDALRTTVMKIPGWTCELPRTKAGNSQSAGYPDLRIVTDTGRVVFLDPKLFAPGSQYSTLRTFYFEPKEATGKVHEDAMHLLVGLEHNDQAAPDRRLGDWRIADLARLRVRLKAEFQASNRDLYEPSLIVAESSD